MSSSCLDRTYEELKLFYFHSNFLRLILRLDRTYEELKPDLVQVLLTALLRLDRTYEELKLLSTAGGGAATIEFGSYL